MGYTMYKIIPFGTYLCLVEFEVAWEYTREKLEKSHLTIIVSLFYNTKNHYMYLPTYLLSSIHNSHTYIYVAL